MKRLLFKLCVASALLALAACSPSNSTPSSNPASGGKIKIENWPNQTGRIKYQLSFPNPVGDIVDASVTTDGNSELAFPVPPVGYVAPVNDSLAEISCTKTLTVVPSDAKISRPFLFNAYLGTSTSPDGIVFLSSAQPPSGFAFPVGFKFAQNVYSDKDVVITGSFNCSSSPSHTINATLKAGWNFLVSEIKTVSATGSTTSFEWTASTDEPSGFKWYYAPNPAR